MHTPGPWRYDRLNWRNEEQEHKWYVHGDCQEDEEGASSVAVCIVEGNATSMPLCEGNARLIATSPRLLAVCEAMLADADATQDDQAACRRLYNAWREMRQAVNEAKGA